MGEIKTNEFRNKILNTYKYGAEKSWDDVATRLFMNDKVPKDLQQFLFDGFKKDWFRFATPVLSNMFAIDEDSGKSRGLPISCFVQYYPDDMAKIMEKDYEASVLSSLGGGIGANRDALREIGTNIADKGKTSGMVSFLQIPEAQTKVVSQGLVRKGSIANYIDVDHPEIEEFIAIREPNDGRPRDRKTINSHHGINLTDEFMEAVEEQLKYSLPTRGKQEKTPEELDAIDIFMEINEQRVMKGEPFLLFERGIKKYRSEVYEKLDLVPNTSNLCVTGEMNLLTTNGNKTFRELYLSQESFEVLVDSRVDDTSMLELDEDFENFIENENYSKVLLKSNPHLFKNELVVRKATKVFLTQKDAEIFKVTFGDGTIFRCTSYHKFYVWRDKNRLMKIPLSRVKINDQVFPAPNSDTDPDVLITTTVVSIEADGIEDVYDCTQPDSHAIIVNGISTGQCTEIFIHTDYEHTAVCCLGSLNAEKWDEFEGDLNSVIYAMSYYLDLVLQETVRLTHEYKNPDILRFVRNSIKDDRSIGITLPFPS